MQSILHIDASGRENGSVSRKLSDAIVEKLKIGETDVLYRDVSRGLPFVDEMMIGSYFTPKEDRSEEQIRSIALSDAIVSELQQADTIVVGMPMYNFSMPAGFKAWCDLAARVGETFQYKDTGPKGLLKNKRAFVAIATGGTKVDTDIDFLTPWLRHYFGFIGIDDVRIIKADRLNREADRAIEQALQEISRLAAA